MRKYFASLTLGVAFILSGVISLIQASNKSLVTMADVVNEGSVSSQTFLVIAGIVLFIIGFVIILVKYLYRESK